MIATKAEVLILLGRSTSLTAADEALIDLLMPLVEAVVVNYLNNGLHYGQHVEYLPIGQTAGEQGALRDQDVDFAGNRALLRGGPPGTDALQLKHTPVVLTGLEVREDIGANAGQAADSFGSDTILTAGTDYWLDIDETGVSRTGILYRSGAWPTEPRSVKVTYYGGHTAAQLNGAAGDIKLVYLRAIRKAFKSEKNQQTGDGPKISESIGKYSYSTSADAANAMAGAGHTIPPEDVAILHRYFNYGRYI